MRSAVFSWSRSCAVELFCTCVVKICPLLQRGRKLCNFHRPPGQAELPNDTFLGHREWWKLHRMSLGANVTSSMLSNKITFLQDYCVCVCFRHRTLAVSGLHADGQQLVSPQAAPGL